VAGPDSAGSTSPRRNRARSASEDGGGPAGEKQFLHTRGVCARLCVTNDVTCAEGGKRRKRVVRAGPALLQGVDDSAVISQYLANGLTYAQSVRILYCPA
jgi:hypothetical protein